MAIYKVSNTVFSPLKTIQKALMKAVDNDTIQLSAGIYDEMITVSNNVTIVGNEQKETRIQGTFYIAGSSKVAFEHIAFHLNTQLIIEGDAQFMNCHFQGNDATAICAIDSGRATFINCTFDGSEIGLYIVHNSLVQLQGCTFQNGQRTHILCEQATVQLENCTLQGGQHALWLKHNARASLKHSTISQHGGTQIVVQHSILDDEYSKFTSGEGNGIFADEGSQVTLYGSEFHTHTLPQIWAKHSTLHATNCSFKNGQESAIMLMLHAEATLAHCYFQKHRLAIVQVIDHSRLNLSDCQLYECEGYGVQVRNKGIANFANALFAHNTLAQLHITKQSIASLKDCKIKKGLHVAIQIEDRSSCDMAQTLVLDHPNTAIIALQSHLGIYDSDVLRNEGNGLLAMEDCDIAIDASRFDYNGMPHIAVKHDVKLTVTDSQFKHGKAIYALTNCTLQLEHVKIEDGDSIQIELLEDCQLDMQHCTIQNGLANGIKASDHCTVKLVHCHVTKHVLPQIVIHESSLICQDSEILDGEHNGFIIEQSSDAFIQNCYIARHQYPQLWVDTRCNVDVISTQIKDGKESDIYVQNNSSIFLDQCMIQNNQSPYSIQAIDFAKVDISRSTIRNPHGQLFYSENNSTITNSLDEDYD